jgi:hypothetical protein
LEGMTCATLRQTRMPALYPAAPFSCALRDDKADEDIGSPTPPLCFRVLCATIRRRRMPALPPRHYVFVWTTPTTIENGVGCFAPPALRLYDDFHNMKTSGVKIVQLNLI